MTNDLVKTLSIVEDSFKNLEQKEVDYLKNEISEILEKSEEIKLLRESRDMQVQNLIKNVEDMKKNIDESPLSFPNHAESGLISTSSFRGSPMNRDKTVDPTIERSEKYDEEEDSNLQKKENNKKNAKIIKHDTDYDEKHELIDRIVGYYKDTSTSDEIEEMINILKWNSRGELKKILFDVDCTFRYKNQSKKKRKVEELKKELNSKEVY